jgi:hypothetical protein
MLLQLGLQLTGGGAAFALAVALAVALIVGAAALALAVFAGTGAGGSGWSHAARPTTAPSMTTHKRMRASKPRRAPAARNP